MTDVAAPNPSSQFKSPVTELYERALKKRRIPMQVQLELTLRCNLRCDHCYLGSDRKREELSTAEVKRILDELAELGTMVLTMTGGEVMLRADFEELYRYAIGKGFIVSVFTNATLIRPRHVELFKTLPPRIVEISLYGLNDDDYTDFTHARVSFANLDANLRSLKAAGVNFLLKSVATVTLGPKIRRMREYAANLGVRFNYATTVYGANDHTPLADAERPDAQAVLENELVHTEEPSPNRIALAKSPNRQFLCGAGRVLMHIDPEGVATRCGLITSELAGHADLRKVSAREAWETLGKGIDDALAEGHPCRDCSIRTLCHRCPATSSSEQEIAMCEAAHHRARAQGQQVADVAPMRMFWQSRENSILKRRFRG